jgi:anti-sigma factor RsiW
MKKPCDNFADLLVDYADGLLDAEQTAKVASHIGGCDNCRTLIQSLQKSLELAEVIWQDNLSQTPETIRIPAPARTTQRSWLRYVAAAIIIISAIFITTNTMEKPVKDQPTFAEIEQKITDAGNAAQLLAAANLLAGYSDAETVKQQYRRIVEIYPHTPAAAKAKSQIE